MKHTLLKYTMIVAVALGVASCIDNTVPYPRLDCSLQSISTEGLKEYEVSAVGDTTLVVLTIDESVDLRSVGFNAATFANQDKATVKYADKTANNVMLGDKWNLRGGVVVAVEIYGYRTIYKFVGEQTISLDFSVEGQMGEAYFEQSVEGNIENRIAMVNVPAGTDFSRINVLRLKLGPEGETTLEPNISGVTDFTSSTGDDHIKVVRVRYRDVVQTWRVIIQEGSTGISSIEPWAKSADVAAMGNPGENHAIEYRVKGAPEWLQAPIDKDNGGDFSTKIKGLEPETTYECRVLSGSEVSAVVEFTTESAPELQNGGFEDWHKDGKIWYPYAAGQPWWDSGNMGATTLGDKWNITTSSEDPRPGSSGKLCARMQSAFPGMGPVGKFAAGNIYTGRFAGLDGMNGTVNFGQPFAGRPTALHGWFKCNVGQIDKVGSGAPVTSGPDRYQIMICLTTDTHAVNTADPSTFFDCKTHSKVVAWGEILGTESVADWTEFTLPLRYVKPDVKPTHIIIIATASSYGDYFTGSTSSWMCVDDFSLIYE